MKVTSDGVKAVAIGVAAIAAGIVAWKLYRKATAAADAVGGALDAAGEAVSDAGDWVWERGENAAEWIKELVGVQRKADPVIASTIGGWNPMIERKQPSGTFAAGVENNPATDINRVDPQGWRYY